METLYEYLLENYKPNEPIFLVELQIEGMSRTNLRQQIKKLTDAGKVKRFDNGVYFLPKKTIFKSGSQLPPEKVLECKYLRDKDKRCGYVSGLMFFNQMGLTTQLGRRIARQQARQPFLGYDISLVEGLARIDIARRDAHLNAVPAVFGQGLGLGPIGLRANRRAVSHTKKRSEGPRGGKGGRSRGSPYS